MLVASSAGAQQPTPLSAPGGILQPLEPPDLSAAKQAQRARARRALGLGAPNAARARRHLALARRAAARAAAAERKAASLRTRAARLAQAEAAPLVALARRQSAFADLQDSRREHHLRGARVDLSVPTAATCPAPPAPSPHSIYTLPAWSDAAGWDAESQYGTLQLADVTGDGADEVIGRSAEGVQLARLSNSTGVFSSLAAGPPLTDAAGWDKDRSALTIRSGDIDGDGRAEIIALDGDAKIVTFDRAGSGTWTQLPASSTPAWDDAGTDWGESTHYETIQLVDLDGDGTDELVARAKRGIVAARFAPGAGGGAWQALAPGPPMADKDGWNHTRYSSTITYGNVDGRPGAEIVALNGAPGITVYSYAPATDSWTRLTEAMPPWPAGTTNWGEAPYYSTLRLANLDGDAAGIQEVLARSKNGLVAARLDPTSNTWTSLATSPVLADAGGWDARGYYETIRVGDLDGDGADEVFARGAKVLVVLDYGATIDPLGSGLSTAGPWTQHTSAPLVPSAWSDAGDYESFRIGDVDGDKADEVVGRDTNGVRTFRYRGGKLVPVVAPFPAFSGAECDAYRAIVAANKASLDGDDLRAAYADPGVNLTELEVPSLRPKGVTRAAWKKVAPQIAKELKAAKGTRQWHVGTNGMQSVIQQSFTPQVGSIGQVSEYFRVKKSDNIAGDILPWLKGIVTAVGVIAEPEGSAISEAVAAGINAAIGTTANNLSPKDRSFELNQTEAQLQARVSQLQQQAIDVNTTNETLIPREYGLMLAIAASDLPAKNAPWQTAWRQSDIFFWQTFAKPFWNVSWCQGSVQTGLFDSSDCITIATTKVQEFWAQPYKPWTRKAEDAAYWIGRGKSSHKAPDYYRTAPTKSLPKGSDVLFGNPSKECRPPFSAATSYTNACLLGVPESDVYLGGNGWDLPRNHITHII